jgi:excisionase family DNA binding protein
MLGCYKIEDCGDILSVQEVRKILGIGSNKVYELLKRGDIKNFKIGRERKIPKHCLEEYIKNMLQANDHCNT